MDNDTGDVDYVAQELRSTGLNVKLDRWNVGAGKRLWDQISHFITDENESDCWAMYAPQNSLLSEACKEEFAYALDRALGSRGRQYPIIGLFPGPIGKASIPAGIRTRLYVSLTDPDWKERVVAAAKGRAPDITTPLVEPYVVRIHDAGEKKVIEVRPRVGMWAPCFVAVPIGEKDDLEPYIIIGPKDQLPKAGVVAVSATRSRNEKFWIISSAQGATPIQSCYLICNKLPTSIGFGQLTDGGPQFVRIF